LGGQHSALILNVRRKGIIKRKVKEGKYIISCFGIVEEDGDKRYLNC